MPVVVHIISGLEVGGAETALVRLVASLRSYRHIVISLGSRGPLADPLERAGAAVHALGLHRRARLASAFLRMRNILHQAEPQVLQSWLVHANIFAAIIGPLLAPSVPLFWNVRQSLDALDREKWLTRKAIRASSLLARVPAAIIYNSQHAATQHEQLGYSVARREVIPNGFDLDKFLPDPMARKTLRPSWGVAKDDILIGLIGRLHPIKNHPAFFTAAEHVLRSQPNAFFIVAGTGTEREQILPLVPSQEVARRLICLGERRDIPELNSALDIACNVSYAEAFPNTVGEAMACEVPCVVTPVGESAILVGESGIVASDASASAIAAALLEMIDLGPAGRSALGKRARQRIAENYSLSTVASRYQAMYDAAASSRKR